MEIKLLDCTLRDGGHVIESNFGELVISGIIDNLVSSNIEIIELGFLKHDVYDADRAVFNDIAQAKALIKKYDCQTEFSLMAQQDQYDANLLPKNDGLINYIRVSFHINDYMEGLEFCKKTIEKGYKCCINPINIMGYTDIQLMDLLQKINELKPDTFTIVDTFGSMQYEDLIRLFYLLNHNLDPAINIGIHLHENMSQSFSLAQEIIRLHNGSRNLTIDASLRGMGRIPGNLPIELMVEYLNRYIGKQYDQNMILDAIDKYVNVFFYKHSWGYDPVYSLAAQFNLHRTYAEYLKNTGKLGTKDIRKILSSIADDKKILYDSTYIKKLYKEYMNVITDDCESLDNLRKALSGKNILVIANGASTTLEADRIDRLLNEHKDMIVISANFYERRWKCHYAFFNNIRRYTACYTNEMETILSSNLIRDNKNAEYIINYSRLCVNDEAECENCMVMILNLLQELNVNEVYLAGFDGYSNNRMNYYKDMFSNTIQPDNINTNIKIYLNRHFGNMKIFFATTSLYEEGE